MSVVKCVLCIEESRAAGKAGTEALPAMYECEARALEVESAYVDPAAPVEARISNLPLCMKHAHKMFPGKDDFYWSDREITALMSAEESDDLRQQARESGIEELANTSRASG